MLVQAFVRNFEDHYTTFRLLFAESVKNPSEEVIHRMRVEMKHLTALLLFIDEHTLSNQAVEENGVIRKIAKKSGRIRDWQIVRNLFCEEGGGVKSEILSDLNSKIAKRQEKYRIFSRNITLENTVVQRLPIDDLELTPDVFFCYADTLKLRYVDYLHQGCSNRDFWHKARHWVKRSFHLMNLGNRFFPGCFQADAIQYCRSLEQLLGKWHDLTLLFDYCYDEAIEPPKPLMFLFEELEQEIELIAGK